MYEKVTMKDIAKDLGISVTTVHRALQGKDGVSEEMVQKIKQLASQMGYKTNYMASSLKRKEFKIAIVLPEPTMNNKYYYLNLWIGARRFLDQVSEFNIKSLDFYYPLQKNSHGDKLKEVYDLYANDIDGLLTIAVDDSNSSYFLEKFSQKNIPIALLGSDLYKELRFCCVKCYDEMVGNLAAELLTSFHPADFSPNIILTGNPIGDLSMLDQYYNFLGFKNYIETNFPRSNLIYTYGHDVNLVKEQLRNTILNAKDIYAIYAQSARHTVLICELIEEMNLQGKIKLVGNDCFSDSISYLQKNILTALIDKKISTQSYVATKILFDFLVKGEYPSSNLTQIQPTIVLKSNIEFHAQNYIF